MRTPPRRGGTYEKGLLRTTHPNLYVPGDQWIWGLGDFSRWRHWVAQSNLVSTPVSVIETYSTICSIMSKPGKWVYYIVTAGEKGRVVAVAKVWGFDM